jgi:hypothetical protein
MASRRAAEMRRYRWRGEMDGRSWSRLSGWVKGANGDATFEGGSMEVMLATGMYNEAKAAGTDFVVKNVCRRRAWTSGDGMKVDLSQLAT